MPVEKQGLTVRLSKLDTSGDPKTTIPGTLELLENAMAIRHSDQGVEFVKRYGLVHLSRSIEGGGSLAAGAKLQAFNDELVATDGTFLYSWSPSLSKWVTRGRCSSVAAKLSIIDGSPSLYSPITDSAYFGGYVIEVADRILGGIHYYVRDQNTGLTVSEGDISGVYPRLAVVGTSVFIFYCDGGNSTLRCRTISASTPSTLSAASSVATNLHSFASSSNVYDAIADPTNSRMVVGYRNTTPTTTLMIWNTNMTAGTTVAYATRDPSSCVGFLKHDFADGNGYLAIGTAADVRCLTFGASSMTVTVDTQVDATVVNAQVATGVFTNSKRHVFFEVPGSAGPPIRTNTNTRIKGWDGTTLFEFMRGATILSRAWTVGTKFYLLAGHVETFQLNAPRQVTRGDVFLLEWNGTAATTGDSGVSVAGFLMGGDGGANISGTFGGSGFLSYPCSPAAISSTHFQLAVPRIQNLATAVAAGPRFLVNRVDLDFSDTQLGAPVAFNRQLHIPGAAAKVYDGAVVYEEGFYTVPEEATASASAGGALSVGTFELFGMWARTGRDGLIQRSAAGPIGSVTTSGGNLTISGTFPAYRMTDSDERYNTNQDLLTTGGSGRSLVTLEVYCTTAGGSVFYLSGRFTNDATADTVSFSIATDPSAALEVAYTQTGAAGNVTPPAILAFEEHRDRLFALASDVVYLSKDFSGGDYAAFAADTDGFFIDFDTAATGDLVGMVSDGTTLFIGSDRRIYPLLGEGPDLAGNNGYAFPQPLPPKIGFRGPRALCPGTDGLVIATNQGFYMLDRGGGIKPLPGADSYESLTVTGGVALDDRSFACLTTSEGTTLVWDWVFQQWYAWTSHAAAASCLWQGKLVLLASDGTAKVDTAGTYSDNGSSITMKLRTGRLSLADFFGSYFAQLMQ